jgi:5-methylcytosine-specific restriction endonuclease McrA
MSRWWRAYDEAVDDPKLQLLPPPLFKAWFNLLCIASANGGTLPAVEAIAFKLRTTDAKVSSMIEELIARGLLDEFDGILRPHNWIGRQYLSDSSTERVKRHRDKRVARGLERQWSAPRALRQAVYQRDEFRCIYCGSTEKLSLDHRTPEFRGGTHDIENLATACQPCNGAKRDLTEEEFRQRTVTETLLKRPQSTEQNTEAESKKEPDANASAGEPTTTDIRKSLFSRGLRMLAETTGKTPDSCRSLVGKWLQTANDEAIHVLGLIEDAHRNNVADPVSWITVRLKTQFGGRNGRLEAGAVSNPHSALAAIREIRERRVAGGQDRTPVVSLSERRLLGREEIRGAARDDSGTIPAGSGGVRDGPDDGSSAPTDFPAFNRGGR